MPELRHHLQPLGVDSDVINDGANGMVSGCIAGQTGCLIIDNRGQGSFHSHAGFVDSRQILVHADSLNEGSGEYGDRYQQTRRNSLVGARIVRSDESKEQA